MAITTTTSRKQYTSTGGTEYPVDFYFPENADLEVVVTDDDGVDTTLTLDTHYTVTGAGAADGGTVTTLAAVPAGYIVTIRRVLDQTQSVSLKTQGGWFPVVHERVFDRLTMLIQQVQEEVDRCLKYSESTLDADVDTDISSAVAARNAAQTAQGLAEDAQTAAEAAQSGAETAQGLAEDARDDAIAAVGGVKVSANDTTPGNLEAKLLAGSGLAASTQNDGGNETRTLAADTANGSETATGTSTAKLVTPDGLNEFIGLHEIFIPASAMTPATTNRPEAATVELTTYKHNVDVLKFDGSVEEFACFQCPMPPQWDRGTVKARVYWDGSSGATAGDTVEWELQGVAVSNDDARDAEYGTAQVISDTLLAVGDLHITAATPAITIGGSPALSDIIQFRLSRNVSGTDDMTEDAQLLGLVIQWAATNTVAAL